jgi:hypothetical protein
MKTRHGLNPETGEISIVMKKSRLESINLENPDLHEKAKA